MIAPLSRIWLYPRKRETLEVVILCDSGPEAARVYAQLHTLARDWPGWQHIDVLGLGLDTVLGLVCTIGPGAHSDEALLEGYRMMSAYAKVREAEAQRPIEWSDGMRTAIGEW